MAAGRTQGEEVTDGGSRQAFAVATLNLYRKVDRGVLAAVAQFVNDVHSDRTRADMRAALDWGDGRSWRLTPTQVAYGPVSFQQENRRAGRTDSLEVPLRERAAGAGLQILGPRRSQAFVLDFQRVSRSAINSARCRSFCPSRMVVSSELARK
jgi:hypothetical protein